MDYEHVFQNIFHIVPARVCVCVYEIALLLLRWLTSLCANSSSSCLKHFGFGYPLPPNYPAGKPCMKIALKSTCSTRMANKLKLSFDNFLTVILLLCEANWAVIQIDSWFNACQSTAKVMCFTDFIAFTIHTRFQLGSIRFSLFVCLCVFVCFVCVSCSSGFVLLINRLALLLLHISSIRCTAP